MDFPHDQYGYPLADGYGIDVDLSLGQYPQNTFWTRQRRGYMHAASAVSVSFELPIRKSGELIAWLQANDSWFNLQLISGDDIGQPCQVYAVNVRRISDAKAERIPFSDKNVVSFEVETHSMPDYEQLRAAVAGQPAFTYPSDTLPIPLASEFRSEHSTRNVTTYSLTYRMDTVTLRKWQAFAAFAGTAWFKHFMVSPNSYGVEEVLRYTSGAQLKLVGPDLWEVSISATGYPNRGAIPAYAVGEVTECSYDYPIDYDFVNEDYDCGDGDVTPPPQGNFTLPSIPVEISNSATGDAPQTATTSLRINRDASVVCAPAGAPGWTQWHTDALTLISPSVVINAGVEVSTDGINWALNVSGTQYSLKDQDVYLRLVHTASADSTRALVVPLQFNDGVATYALANATIQFYIALTIALPGSGVVSGFTWYDYDSSIDTILSVGVQVNPDGSCYAGSNGLPTDAWNDPIAAGVGNGKWVAVTKQSGTHTLNNIGVRQELNAPRAFSIVIRNPNNTAEVNGTFVGSVSIYSAQVGGILLGTGTLQLEGTLTGGGNPP
jgi:hypothetical protein